MSTPKVSIVIPSYNESAQIKERAIEEIDNYLKKQSYSFEVLIVDDCSTNGTVEQLEEEIKNKKNFRLLKNEHGGKAITVMTGLLESKGDIALFTDMDQATPITELEKVLGKFNEGYDIVIGQRQGRRGAPWIRKMAAIGFAMLRKILIGLPFEDTQCGFKAFSRQAAEEIFPQLLKEWQKMKAKGAAVNAGFDVETLFIAKKKGYKIAAVNVEWKHVENVKQVQLMMDSLEALKDMLRVKLNYLAGKY